VSDASALRKLQEMCIKQLDHLRVLAENEAKRRWDDLWASGYGRRYTLGESIPSHVTEFGRWRRARLKGNELRQLVNKAKEAADKRTDEDLFLIECICISLSRCPLFEKKNVKT
jgi:hypothetical protein